MLEGFYSTCFMHEGIVVKQTNLGKVYFIQVKVGYDQSFNHLSPGEAHFLKVIQSIQSPGLVP